MKQIILIFIVALMSTSQVTYGQSQGKAQKTVLLPSYIESVGRIAYVWGWPMVNLYNRQKMFEQVPIQGFLGGVMPVAPINKLTLFPDYGTPDQKDVAHPNQDVIYGFGITDLNKSPVVIQVPTLVSDSGCMSLQTSVRIVIVRSVKCTVQNLDTIWLLVLSGKVQNRME